MSTKQNKTVPTAVNPEQFVKTVEKKYQEDALKLVSFFEKITGKRCVRWGKILGFGNYHYKYASGREGAVSMPPAFVRSNGIVIYSLVGYKQFSDLLLKLGKHSLTGQSCLQIRSLGDIDMGVLEKIVVASLSELSKRNIVS